MADNDTAALVVALSAQLSKFEKDMKGAVDIADRRTKDIENRFTAMNSAIQGKLQQLGASASANLGFAGTLLNTLGPAGITAAIGIGAAVGGVLALANAAEEFAIKARRLKEGADIAGLTITQFKLLGSAGGKVGLDFDETSSFFTKFIANLSELRGGSGPLFDALLKIDSGLLRQLSTTKDSAKAVDLLIAAFARLDNQSQKLELAKAAGGKGGLAGTRLLDSLANQGGLSGLQANSPAVDEGQISRAAALRVEIEGIAKKTANIWGGMFSDVILTHQRDAVQEMQNLSLWIEKVVGAKERAARAGNPEGAAADDLAAEKERLEAELKAIDAARASNEEHQKALVQFGYTKAQIEAEIPALKGLEQSYDGVTKRLKEVNEQLDSTREKFGALPSAKLPEAGAAPVNTRLAREGLSGPAAVDASPSADLAILQKNLALLGEAVSVGEQWKRKRLEIAAAAEKGGIDDTTAQRALAAFGLTMQSAALAARERFGIATQQQIAEAKLIQLEQERVKVGLSNLDVQRAKKVIEQESIIAVEAARERLGVATEQQIAESRLLQLEQDRQKFDLSDAEVQRAKVIILREAKDAADALTVRQAYLPGLAQMGIDAQNAQKNLDSFAVNSLNNLENALVDVINGTKTASEAFKAMANAIISDLARIAIRQSITGPIAAALGGGGGIFGALFGGARAGGGPVEAGKAYLVNENTPNSEYFVPGVSGTIVPSAPSIVPNSANGRSGGGQPINVNIYSSPVYQAGMTPTDMAAIEALQQQNNEQLRQQVQTDLRNGIRNDADFLSH